MNDKPIDCIDLVELVTECLEQTLERETLMQILDHLPYCKGCDDYFNQVLVTLKALSGLSEKDIPAELEENLLARFREWAESSVSEGSGVS